MKKRLISIISAMFFCVVSFNPISLVVQAKDSVNSVTEEIKVRNSDYNLALNKSAYSSGNETSSLTPGKAFDGNTTARDSRWSSADFNENVGAWIYVDLGEVKEVKEFHLYWEEAAAKEYEIQVSNDASNWKTVSTINDGTGGKKVIILDETENSRYVRVFIKKNTPQVWNCVSLYELEVYKETPPKEIEDIANEFTTAPTISENGEFIILPEAPDGCTLKLYGTDRAEVIDLNGKITIPLEDVSINLLYELTSEVNNERKAITKNIAIDIKGSNIEEQGDNNKPFVIPSLREWAGNNGEYTLTDSSNIVVNPKYKDVLESSAEITKEDLKDITGKEVEIEYGSPEEGDLYLTLNETDKVLGAQGYEFIVDDYVTIIAPEEKGVFYGTRTALQILKQDEGNDNIPKGEARDYPKYGKRGFMLDAGRKFFSLDYLEDTVKLMSWYKMNDFQVHLNDNAFVEQFGGEWDKVYSGFRLESETYPGLASKDGHYTKEEFRNFQKESNKYGMNIIPEIDTPAHSLAISHYMPELASKKYGPDHLDLENPKSYEFVSSLFDEYLSGDDPVFVGPDVHIGTDEYKGADQPTKELFRKFADNLINLVNGYGKDPMFWGSLTALNGETPVSNDATLAAWYNGYADPVEMAKQGYDLISIPDGTVYIVPAAGYYNDYLNTSNLYRNWEPNKIGNVTFPYGHPQLKGGMFALWNDVYRNGISKHDTHDRIFPAVQTLSEKMWSGSDSEIDYSTFVTLSEKVGEAPNANISHKIEEELPNNKVIGINFDKELVNESDLEIVLKEKNITKNVAGKQGNAIKLNGGESYIETNMDSLGFGWTMSMWINPDLNNENDSVIMESEEGTLKLKQGDTSKLGFSKGGYDHYFDYVVPENKWTQITLTGDNKGTSLYVNGELQERLEGNGVPEITGGETRRYIQTFVLPINYIGSKTNSFKGYLDEVEVYNRVLTDAEIDKNIIDKNQMTVIATSFEVAGSNNRPERAIDGIKDTFWHTNWSGEDVLPQSITLELGGKYLIDKYTYLPRQSGENGIITKYELQISNDGTNFTTVSTGKWNKDGLVKKVSFEPVEATHVKLIALEGVGGYASAAELNVYKSVQEEIVVSKVRDLKASEATSNTVKLIWNVPEKAVGLTEYVVYKDGKKLVSVPAGTVEYEVSNLRSNTIYGLKVSAKYSNGEESKPKSVNIRTRK